MKLSLNAKSNLYSLLSQATVFGFAFLVFMVLVRTLSREDFGTWVLYQTIMTFAEMARMGFIQNGLVKYIVDNPNDRKSIIGSAWLLNLVSGVLLWLVLWGLSFPLSELWEAPLLVDLAFYYGLVVIGWGSFRFLEYILVADRDFKAVFWSHLINGGLYFSLVLGVAVTAYLTSPVQVLWWQSLAATVVVGIMGYLHRDKLTIGRPSKRWMKELAQYGRFSMGSSLGSILLQRLDVLMLGYFLGPASVALYNIGTKLTNYLEIPMRSVTLVIFPQLSQNFNEKGAAAMARLWERSVSQLIALVLPPCILLWVLARPAITLIAGAEYADSAPILQIFLLTALIKPWGRMAGISLEAIGRPKLNFRLVWASLGLNLGWNLLFIPMAGVVGAAWATVISMVITTILGVIVFRRHVPLQVMSAIRGVPAVYQEQARKLLARMAWS